MYFVKLVHKTKLASDWHTEKLNRSLKWENYQERYEVPWGMLSDAPSILNKPYPQGFYIFRTAAYRQSPEKMKDPLFKCLMERNTEMYL